MDNDKESEKAYKKLDKDFNEIIKNKLEKIDKAGIEDMFKKQELKLVDDSIINSKTKNVIEAINNSI
jgi:hypothetical protein